MKVRELFTSEKKWTKFNSAVDVHGKACELYSPKAYAFCLTGAIYKCYSKKKRYYYIRESVENSIAKTSRGIYTSVVQWNDYSRRTFKQVKTLVEKLDI